VEQGLTELIEQAKRGNKQAFTELIERSKRQVFYQAYGMLNDRQEAEDIVQEAFMKAYFSLKQLGSPYAFTAWLSRIVYHLCQDRIKKRDKQDALTRKWLNEKIDNANHSRNQIEQKQLGIDLHRAMQALTLEHRTVLILREIQGLSYQEIANILGVPEGTVKSRIHKARLALRNELQKRGD
jgi:RNA polymerase sigma factor (sigma-70 family)